MSISVARLLVALIFICTFIFAQNSEAAAPQPGSHGVILFGQDDQDGMLPGVVVPPAPPPTTGQDGMLPEVVVPPAAPPPTGQDGMLPDETSVDDDGDGVQDADDSAPHNPNEGTRPVPGPTDPIADDDNDGLPNVMDPDDNNNGQPDADEGVGTVGDGPKTPAPTKQRPDSRNAPSVSPTSGRDRGAIERPAVLALPSTGSGMAHRWPMPSMLMAGSITLVVAAGLSRQKQRG